VQRGEFIFCQYKSANSVSGSEGQNVEAHLKEKKKRKKRSSEL